MRCQAAPAELLDYAAISQLTRMLQQDVAAAVRPLVGMHRVTDNSPARTAQLASRCLLWVEMGWYWVCVVRGAGLHIGDGLC